MKIVEPKRLSEEEVGEMIGEFLEHLAEQWNFYRKNILYLRWTMAVYDLFSYAVTWLPENSRHQIEFNRNDPLINALPSVFGKRYSRSVKNEIYAALRVSANMLLPGDLPNIAQHMRLKVEETPAQKMALDKIRNHPRIKLGIKLLKKEIRQAKERRKTEEQVEKRRWKRKMAAAWRRIEKEKNEQQRKSKKP